MVTENDHYFCESKCPKCPFEGMPLLQEKRCGKYVASTQGIRIQVGTSVRGPVGRVWRIGGSFDRIHQS